MPPQMASSATFSSWKTIFLLASRQVVEVTAAGLMVVEARIWRTSRWSCRTMTRGNMWYAGAARVVDERERARRREVRVLDSILVVWVVFLFVCGYRPWGRGHSKVRSWKGRVCEMKDCQSLYIETITDPAGSERKGEGADNSSFSSLLGLKLIKTE